MSQTPYMQHVSAKSSRCVVLKAKQSSHREVHLGHGAERKLAPAAQLDLTTLQLPKVQRMV